MEVQPEQAWGNGSIIVVILFDSRPHYILRIRTDGVIESSLKSLALDQRTSKENVAYKEKSNYF